MKAAIGLSLITMLVLNCAAGSFTFKRMPGRSDTGICNYGSRSYHTVVKDYKKYSEVQKLENDIQTAIDIQWSEYKYWYIVFVFVPVPLFGIPKEREPAALNITVSNNRSTPVQWDTCKIDLRLEDQTILHSEMPCDAKSKIAIAPNSQKSYRFEYKGNAFKDVTEVLLSFQIGGSEQMFTQAIKTENYWEYCTTQIN